MNLEQRLEAQNAIGSWIDCNERDLGHRWVQDSPAGWWRCARGSCKVSTVRRDGRRPSPHLGGDAR